MESVKYYWVIKVIGPNNSTRGYVAGIYHYNYLPAPNGLMLDIANALKFSYAPLKLIKFFNESLGDENCELYKAVRTTQIVVESGDE
jgi:hypothetical protein